MEVQKGEQVVFFNGRQAKRGIVEEIQDDDTIIIRTQQNGGTVRLVKDADEVMPFKEIKGKRSSIRFKESVT